MAQTPELMTVKETAAYLRIPLPTVYYLVQRGQLPAIQIGGRWRIKRSLLDRDILRNEEESQPTVLVVDSDTEVQSQFRQFLKKAGYGRIMVQSGEEAISLAQKQKFNLAFISLKTTDLQGEDFYQQFKDSAPDLPIVLLVDGDEGNAIGQVLARGPVTIISKPIDFEQLEQTIKALGHRASVAA